MNTGPRVLARMTCPQCNRPNVAVRQNFTIYPHTAHDDPYEVLIGPIPCYGSHPEVTFTVMIRAYQMDARADRFAGIPEIVAVVPEDDWHVRRDEHDFAEIIGEPMPPPRSTR